MEKAGIQKIRTFVKNLKLFVEYGERSSSSLVASTTNLFLLLLLLSIRLAIFYVSILNLFTSARILKLLDYLSSSVTLAIHLGLFGYCLLTAVFNHC